jgi:hypothetical protein
MAPLPAFLQIRARTRVSFEISANLILDQVAATIRSTEDAGRIVA